MIRRRRHKSVLNETYQDFAENTSIHGLKYTVRGDIPLGEKLFWYVVVLSGIGGALFMTYLFWVRYTSNPTRTTILTTYAPSTTVPFPSVTICNVNRIFQYKIDQFVSKLTIRDDELEIVRRALPSLTAFTYPEEIPFNETDLKVLQTVLYRNDYSDVVLVMRKITQSCAELLVKCKWENIEFNCMDLFAQSFTIDGLCCSFNYYMASPKGPERESKVKYSSYYGFESGLQVLVDPMVQPIQYSKYSASGIKVILHDAFDYPAQGSISRVVSVGHLAYFQLRVDELRFSREVKKMPIEQRNCLYSNERWLYSFQTEYADTNCLEECDIDMFQKMCNCVPYYYGLKDSAVCSVTEIPCLALSQEAAKDDNCNCEPQCEDAFYDISYSSTEITSNEGLFTATSFEKSTAIENNSIVRVFFGSERHQILYKDSITSATYLLSSFGGVYSLFLGCSLMTIVEVIYYSLMRFTINMKVFKGELSEPKREENRKTLKTHNESIKTYYTFHQFIN